MNREFLSSAEAADELGVSAHQVAMLAKRGEIVATKVGNTLLIDPYSLNSYQQARKGQGRPWNNSVSWALLWALSGLEPDWLSYQQQRRLSERIASTTADDIVWRTRKRSKLHVYRADPSVFDELKGHLFLTGKSTDRPDIFGMPQNTVEVEGYVDAAFLSEFETYFKMQPSNRGNVLLHAYTDQPWNDATPFVQMPVAVVACDLAASLDPREAHAGHAALEILLGGLRGI